MKNKISLSEDERKELEKLRAEKKANEKFKEALFVRGLFPSLIFSWIIPYFTPDTVFGRSIGILGSFVCLAVGFLSSYYGPFKNRVGDDDKLSETHFTIP